MKPLFCFLVIFLLLPPCKAAENPAHEYFFMDAVTFKSDNSGKGRLDVYAIIPYGSLKFLSSSGRFASRYELGIDIRDTDGRSTASKSTERIVTAGDMFESQGGTAKFDYSQHVFELPPGDYEVILNISDRPNNIYYERSRTVTVLDFDKFDFSSSGLLLLSSIEEVNGRYKISPHISDNISDLNDGFFIFFETYGKDSAGRTVNAVYQIWNGQNELVRSGEKTRLDIRSPRQQHFIRVKDLDTLQPGAYVLKLLLLKDSDDPLPKEKDYLAISQRTIKKLSGFETKHFADLNEGIRFMRYVATSDQIDHIENAKDEREKTIRFEQFWRDLDPSPGTLRNEAYEEYYERVAYANRTFKLYTEGWLSDKGRIYIVLGPPLQAEASSSGQMGTAQYERWIYPNNREFIFYDRNGFGEFRLERPAYFNEKYKFNKN